MRKNINMKYVEDAHKRFEQLKAVIEGAYPEDASAIINRFIWASKNPRQQAARLAVVYGSEYLEETDWDHIEVGVASANESYKYFEYARCTMRDKDFPVIGTFGEKGLIRYMQIRMPDRATY